MSEERCPNCGETLDDYTDLRACDRCDRVFCCDECVMPFMLGDDSTQYVYCPDHWPAAAGPVPALRGKQ